MVIKEPVGEDIIATMAHYILEPLHIWNRLMCIFSRGIVLLNVLNIEVFSFQESGIEGFHCI